jgi:phosphoglycolate phosphatase-like HAD superfamily hydrolase
VAPRSLPRGLVAFDLDGTILDDIGLIGDVAGDVLLHAFGTPAEEGRLHYLATTGMPFEAQLAQLYPDAPAALRAETARTFHQRKVAEAYASAGLFPDIPKLLRRLDAGRWTLAVSTGAEREMADLVLEREGLRYWFDGVLGSAQGTKREHLAEFRRRYPGARIFLVGDSRFDMEVASGSEGVVGIGRATSLRGWTLTPDDLKRWGAAWADYSLAGLPEALDQIDVPAGSRDRPAPTRRRSRAGKK